MADSGEKGKFKFGFKPELKFKVSDEADSKAKEKSGKEQGKANSSDQTVEDKLAELEAELNSQKAESSFKNSLSKPTVPPKSKSADSALSKISSWHKSGSSSSSEPSHTHMALFWGMIVLSLVLANLHYANILFTPITQFTTLVHEMGHAFATILTGGHVNGLTMVSDGQGHGGLTRGVGGLDFITVQAGYLGTAIAGCTLVYLSKFRKWSRHVLLGIGVIIAYVSIFMMPGGIFSIHPVQAILSIGWGLALAAAIIWAGLKLKDTTANLILLFLAIQTAGDSIKSIFYVIQSTMMGSGVVSDAVIMQQFFFLPAIFWSISWVLISVFMLAVTIWFTYGAGVFQGKALKTIGSGTTGKGTISTGLKKAKGK
jgi:hypothetical protein